MKISFIIKKVVSVIGRKGAVLVASLISFMLHAMPALASPEAAPSRSGSVLNILLLGCIAYFLVRSFRRRSGGDDKPRQNNWTRPDDDDEGKNADRPVGKPMDKHEAARQAWSVLSSESPKPKPKPKLVRPVAVPSESFNEAEFLEGAKLFFTRFYQAQDSNELQDLRGFISDEVYADALAAAQNRSVQGNVMTTVLNARLMEMKTEAGRTSTTVFYDAQTRREGAGEQPVHIRVVWEFSRDDSAPNALWVLEKINKVDQ